WIFAVRTIASRLSREPALVYPSFLELALSLGWRILDEEDGRELVAGAVTQPWAAKVEFRGLALSGLQASPSRDLRRSPGASPLSRTAPAAAQPSKRASRPPMPARGGGSGFIGFSSARG